MAAHSVHAGAHRTTNARQEGRRRVMYETAKAASGWNVVAVDWSAYGDTATVDRKIIQSGLTEAQAEAKARELAERDGPHEIVLGGVNEYEVNRLPAGSGPRCKKKSRTLYRKAEPGPRKRPRSVCWHCFSRGKHAKNCPLA